MPIYIYKFIDNGEIVEKFGKMCDPPLKEIDGREVVRIPTKPNFKFNGNGFYSTDYGQK